jgi:uncharacterized protein with NRDE domain
VRGKPPETGVDEDLEHMLGAPFILSGEYGLRPATTVTLSANSRVHFEECTFDSARRQRSARAYRFTTADH